MSKNIVEKISRKFKGNGFKYSLDQANSNKIFGWVFDSKSSTHHLQVQLREGDKVVATVTADEFRQDLLDAGIGLGHCGFHFDMQTLALEQPEASIDLYASGKKLNQLPIVIKIEMQTPPQKTPPQKSAVLENYRVHVDKNIPGQILGWALDDSRQAHKPHIECKLGELTLGTATADRPQDDQHNAGIGDVKLAFTIDYNLALLPDDGAELEVFVDGILFDKPDISFSLSSAEVQEAKKKQRRNIIMEQESQQPAALTMLKQEQTKPQSAFTLANYRVRVENNQPGKIAGWAIDDSRLAHKPSIECRLDKLTLGACVANIHRDDLVKAGVGDGKLAFTIDYDLALLPDNGAGLEVFVDGILLVKPNISFSLSPTEVQEAKDKQVQSIFLEGDSQQVVALSMEEQEQKSSQLVPILDNYKVQVDINIPGKIAGWAFDHSRQAHKPHIECKLGELSLGVCIADIFREDLAEAGVSDGKLAFTIDYDLALLPDDVAELEVTVDGVLLLRPGISFSLTPTEIQKAKDKQVEATVAKEDGKQPVSPTMVKQVQKTLQSATTLADYLVHVENNIPGKISGWALDDSCQAHKPHIECKLGELTLGTATADTFRDDLAKAGIGDGKHAFTIDYDVALLPDGGAGLKVMVDGIVFVDSEKTFTLSSADIQKAKETKQQAIFVAGVKREITDITQQISQHNMNEGLPTDSMAGVCSVFVERMAELSFRLAVIEKNLVAKLARN